MTIRKVRRRQNKICVNTVGIMIPARQLAATYSASAKGGRHFLQGQVFELRAVSQVLGIQLLNGGQPPPPRRRVTGCFFFGERLTGFGPKRPPPLKWGESEAQNEAKWPAPKMYVRENESDPLWGGGVVTDWFPKAAGLKKKQWKVIPPAPPNRSAIIWS